MTRPILEEKDLLTVLEAIELFGLSRRKMLLLTKEENLPFIAKFKGRKLVIKDEFIRYLENSEIKENLKNARTKTRF
ncbi:MAG: DNA-binding protein [Oscillospiraceae bacterium]